MLVVTGSSGFVGSHFLDFIDHLSPTAGAKTDVIPLYKSRLVSGGTAIDLTDMDAITGLFKGCHVSGIIHLAAESRTGICQSKPELATLMNVTATRNLLTAAEAVGNPWFLYVSTDMVFSGQEGNYDVSDLTNPINNYGVSKVEAERSVQNYAGKWCIVRPALIYGASLRGTGSSFSWTLDMLKSGQGQFFDDEIRTPVYVDDLVRLIHELSIEQYQGIVHAGGPDKCSRFSFAEQVAYLWELPIEDGHKAKLSSTPGTEWRPRDLSLVSGEAHNRFQFRTVEEGLKDILRNYKS